VTNAARRRSTTASSTANGVTVPHGSITMPGPANTALLIATSTVVVSAAGSLTTTRPAQSATRSSPQNGPMPSTAQKPADREHIGSANARPLHHQDRPRLPQNDPCSARRPRSASDGSRQPAWSNASGLRAGPGRPARHVTIWIKQLDYRGVRCAISPSIVERTVGQPRRRWFLPATRQPLRPFPLRSS
jgi:hypothetical protein